MLWPWIVAMLTYGLFGDGPHANDLPSPGDLAAKARAMMKPKSPETNVPVKKFWTDRRIAITATVAVAAIGTVVVAGAYKAGKARSK